MKKCLFILPYFGTFPGYFPLFLKSCENNTEFQWLIWTDDKTEYPYPANVTVEYQTLAGLKKRLEEKLGIPVALTKPYKLCDVRPAYGLLFEEYLTEYEYWGYCDCDLIFGNLNRMLSPLLNQGYEKLFAAGHMTLIRNTEQNRRRFFHECNGEFFYKEAFSTEKPCWFDEDFKDKSIHRIFLYEGAKVYAEDMAFSVSAKRSQFCRAVYTGNETQFQTGDYERAMYLWKDGEVERLVLTKDGRIQKENYLYMHFQMRPMRYRSGMERERLLQIYPNGFRKRKHEPRTKGEWLAGSRYSPNLMLFKRKWNNMKKRVTGKYAERKSAH